VRVHVAGGAVGSDRTHGDDPGRAGSHHVTTGASRLLVSPFERIAGESVLRDGVARGPPALHGMARRAVHDAAREGRGAGVWIRRMTRRAGGEERFRATLAPEKSWHFSHATSV
jgi:hypothetical protein